LRINSVYTSATEMNNPTAVNASNISESVIIGSQ
jgi:hypothetical protein